MGQPIRIGTSTQADDANNLPVTAHSAPNSTRVSKQTTAADNANWQNQFGFPGSFHTVEALGASKKNVYASLFFSGEVGKLKVEGHTAYWDGGLWHGMGKGTDSEPSAFAASGDDVYVCGGFNNTDGKAIAGVARWNETTLSWSAVGSGIGPRKDVSIVNTPNCAAVTTLGSDVYIGGDFEAVDGVEAYNVAKWNGAAWSAIGYGLYYDPTGQPGAAYALGALPDGKIVVGGKFTHVYNAATGTAKTAMSNIALWDPVSKKYVPMGSGLTAPPTSMVVVGNDVYVGGDFAIAGGVAVNGIARWDGGKWNAVGGGLSGGGTFGSGSISALAWRDGKLYVGGSFGGIGGISAHRIAKWDGTTWTGLDKTNSNADDVSGVAITGDGSVFVAGDFNTLGGLDANNIARWVDAESRWRTIGYGLADSSLSGRITASYVLPDGKVLVVGDFASAEGKPMNSMATWDPINKEWTAWQGGVDGTVNIIVRNGDLLYFGGAFTKIGGIGAPKIASYNLVTGQWSSLGTGLDGSVFAIAFAPDGIVYVGGVFTATPNGPAERFALYNPATNTWSAPPFQFDFPGAYYTPKVLDLVADSNGVLIGGSFFRLRVDGNYVQDRQNGLFYWNRKTGALTQFGKGATYLNDLLGSINAIVPMPDGSFYVGGRFDKIGPGIAANNAARLTSAGWQPLGIGVNVTGPNTPYILDMKRNGDRIFVGGTFFTAGSTDSENAAVWNIATGQWEALGDGVYGGDIDSKVNCIAFGSNAVYFGGEFHFAGAGQASSFAAWNFTPTQLPTGTLDKKVFLPVALR